MGARGLVTACQAATAMSWRVEAEAKPIVAMRAATKMVRID
jgi:hypothetical protein